MSAALFTNEPDVDPDPPPPKPPGGATKPERWAVASCLRELAAPGVNGDERCRAMGASLYALTDAELAWLSGVLQWVLCE